MCSFWGAGSTTSCHSASRTLAPFPTLSTQVLGKRPHLGDPRGRGGQSRALSADAPRGPESLRRSVHARRFPRPSPCTFPRPLGPGPFLPHRRWGRREAALRASPSRGRRSPGPGRLCGTERRGRSRHSRQSLCGAPRGLRPPGVQVSPAPGGAAESLLSVSGRSPRDTGSLESGAGAHRGSLSAKWEAMSPRRPEAVPSVAFFPSSASSP